MADSYILREEKDKQNETNIRSLAYNVATSTLSDKPTSKISRRHYSGGDEFNEFKEENSIKKNTQEDSSEENNDGQKNPQRTYVPESALQDFSDENPVFKSDKNNILNWELLEFRNKPALRYSVDTRAVVAHARRLLAAPELTRVATQLGKGAAIVYAAMFP